MPKYIRNIQKLRKKQNWQKTYQISIIHILYILYIFLFFLFCIFVIFCIYCCICLLLFFWSIWKFPRIYKTCKYEAKPMPREARMLCRGLEARPREGLPGLKGGTPSWHKPGMLSGRWASSEPTSFDANFCNVLWWHFGDLLTSKSSKCWTENEPKCFQNRFQN